ncbi:DUF4845 domain-containing protein [Denitrificimonas caeni]|uniref:DUF4845 domain-containing protein n=1 Tax=Denitrificimonas caeni TaxID=521720 RepID=UPI001966B887|nr:DUF4845 domain-containing protein [Denitrificimonas caeni]
MHQVRAQRGVSFFTGLVILALLGFFASAAFKLIPHYIDNATLDKAIIAADSSIGDSIDSTADLYSYISKTILANNIRDLKVDDIIQITQANNEFLVHLNYERREPLIKNINLVVTFDKKYRVRAR